MTNSMIGKLNCYLYLFSMLCLFGCGSSCIECVNSSSGDSWEACEDGLTRHTDVNGNAIPFSSLASAWEPLGYICE